MQRNISILCGGLILLLLSLTPGSDALAGSETLAPGVRDQLDSLPDDLTRIELLQEMVVESPADPSLYFALGNLLLDAGKLDQAVQALLMVTELDTTFLGGWVNLGNAYDELGQLDLALEKYQAALALSPLDEKTLCNIGGVYFKKRQIPQALASFEAAIEANPGSQLAHYNLAILFADSEIYREAEREWQIVVEIDPQSDLGQRSADNMEIIRQLLEAETPELPAGSGQ